MSAKRPPPSSPSTFPPLSPDTDEPPTGRSNQTLQLYQAMLARFDLLNDSERTDLVELLSLFAEAAPGDRQFLLALARRFTRR